MANKLDGLSWIREDIPSEGPRWGKGELVESDQGSHTREGTNEESERGGSKWWLLLLLLPYIGLLYPPIYARVEPTLWGFPFFIWYQFLWVFIGVAITAFVYKVRG